MLRRTTSHDGDRAARQFHNKRSNLPVTYAAWRFRPSGGAACSFTL